MRDQASESAGFSHPGADTRQWTSYGQVLPDTPSARSVRYLDDNGAPLPQGLLVDVVLQPSGITVPCRVAMHSAGSGEGEYSPFGPGDEVLVAIPEGDERAGCAIIGRFSNSRDTFPTTVAGQDVTNNSVTFKRIATPYVLETAYSYLVRSALTGAQIALDATGNVILADGNGNTLSLTHSVLSLQDSTGAALVQIDPSKLTVALQADQTSLVLSKSSSIFSSPGTLAIGTSGSIPTGHAATIEQVVAFIMSICTQSPPGPLIGAAIVASMAAFIPNAASFPLPPPVSVAIKAALVASPPDPTGTIPGFGKAGLTF